MQISRPPVIPPTIVPFKNCPPFPDEGTDLELVDAPSAIFLEKKVDYISLTLPIPKTKTTKVWIL